MPNQTSQQQNEEGNKPNFYNLYMKVGEMSADIKDMKKDLEDVCRMAQDAKNKADSVQNKAIGISLGISLIMGIIGFFTDWFGFRK